MSLSPRFLEWGMRFLFNSTQVKFERNTIDVLKLAMRGRDAFREISRSIEFDHRATGKLNIYSSRKSLEKASRLSDLKNRYGADQVILSVDESIARESSLEHYGHAFAGALWSPHDESGDSFLFCQALKRLLERDFDVKFMFHTVVKSINAKKGRICSVVTDKFEMPCSAAVLSLGSSTAFIARTIGIHVPIWPVQGYSMTVPATAHAPTASITDAARKTVFCRIGERLRIAGLADIGYGKEGFRQERFQTLFETARGIFPKAGDYNGEVSGWTGLRPVTPNSQPIVGRSKIDGVFLNCGHGTLGWTLSMATAEILAINAADSIDCRGG